MKSHMLYRIQTVVFVTFSLESVSVIFSLILIYIFLILHEASTFKKGARIFKVLHINACINHSFIFFHLYAKIHSLPLLTVLGLCWKVFFHILARFVEGV